FSCFFNDTATPEIYTLSLHDALPIYAAFLALHNRGWHGMQFDLNYTYSKSLDQIGTVQNSASYFASSFNPAYEYGPSFFDRPHRSEEHTSELQSPYDLVCRLLLEKKK